MSARLMTQFGLYSQTTPRDDASPSRGQRNLDNAYRYISEAYGGYHFDKLLPPPAALRISRQIPAIPTKPGMPLPLSTGCPANNHFSPPDGNNGAPASFACLQSFTTCDRSASNTWLPDLRKIENRLNLAILVKF